MKNIYEQAKENKKNIINIVWISILLALSINLLSYGLCELLNLKEYYFYIGLEFLIIGLFFVIFKTSRISNAEFKIEGFYIVDKNSDIIKIPQYDLSDDMATYLKSAKAENKAISTIIKNENFRLDIINQKDYFIEVKKSESLKILEELISYSLLKQISYCTENYFKNVNLPKGSELIELKRENLPDIVLKNRFFRMFTEPMENRSQFLKKEDVKVFKNRNKNVCMSYADEGAFYENFEIKLPKGTKVFIDKNDYIIDLKYFILKFRVNCMGYSTVTPRKFQELYIGSYGNEYMFETKFKINFKNSFLFKKVNQKMYDWIDDLFIRLSSYLSKDVFFQKIQWERIYAEQIVEKNKKLLLKSK